MTGEASPFVGRGPVLARLDQAVDEARSGRFVAVVLSGPAGIGKSRVVAEATAPARLAAAHVVRGAGRADGVRLSPLEPVRQLCDLDALGAAVADRHPDGGREALFRAIADEAEARARRAGLLVVVLEDLHWADATTLELLPFLARRLATAPVLLVATHRDGHEVTRELRALLVALQRSPAVTRLVLDPLVPDELAALARHRLGRAVPPATLAGVIARSEGITLFAEELLDAWGEGEPGGVPASLREHFTAVLDRLGGGARELVDQMAVCGSHICLQLVRAVSELSHASLEKQLDELVDAGVLVVDRAGTGYLFRHDLLLDTVLAELRPAARRRLHARCAAVLAQHPELSPEGRPVAGELARHWHEAEEPGHELRATIRAGQEATASRAYVEAMRRELRALELLDALPAAAHQDVDRAAVLRRASVSAGLAGEHATAVRLLQELVADVDDPVRRAHLQGELIGEQFLASDQDGAARTGLQALAQLDDGNPALRAGLLARSAFAFMSPDVPGTPLEATTEALALVDADPALPAEARCLVLSSHALALGTFGQVTEARQALVEAEALSHAVDDPRAAMRPAVYRTILLRRAGLWDEVVGLGREAVARADLLGVSRSVGQQLRVQLVDALVELGRLDEAEEVVEDGLVWGTASLPGTLLLLSRAGVAVRRGRTAAARTDLDHAQDGPAAAQPRWSLVSAELAWREADVAASRFHAGRGLERVGAGTGYDELGALTHALARAVAAAPEQAGEHERALLEHGLGLLAAFAGQPVAAAWRASALAEQQRDEDPTGAVPRPREAEHPLTGREAEVLSLLVLGRTNKRIAAELGISARTVGTHVSRILDKLGVHTRGEAAATAYRLGLGPDPTVGT